MEENQRCEKSRVRRFEVWRARPKLWLLFTAFTFTVLTNALIYGKEDSVLTEKITKTQRLSLYPGQCNSEIEKIHVEDTGL